MTPETSYGFDVIEFADRVLGTPLDPWEQWAAIHIGELLPDGRPRFRVVLLIVARQNGKTLLARVLILYWLFVEAQALTLGTSTDRSYAKRLWSKICEIAKDNEYLSRRLTRSSIRLTIGEESLTTSEGAEYIFAANNGSAGRSTTLHRWVCDELRQHSTFDAWGSATNAMNAVPDAQVVAVTNQGQDSAVVLESIRSAAIDHLETGEGDPRVGLFEWSAPAGSDPCDLAALAQANPNLGTRVDADALLGAARRAKRAGGLELATFRTEAMCIKVDLLDPAIDPDAWTAAGTDEPINLAEHRDRVALGLDVSLDEQHVSLVAAATIGGVTHVDVVRAWQGWDCVREAARELPGIVTRVRPRVLGWLPGGPTAALAADLAERRGPDRWPPRGVKLAPITSGTPGICMAVPGLAKSELRHARDPMLDEQVGNAQRLPRGDGWVFMRRGTGPIDGVYSMAVAIHLSRTLPTKTRLTVL